MINEKWIQDNIDLCRVLGQSIARGKQYRDFLVRDTPPLSRFTGKYIQPQLLHACTELALSQGLASLQDINISEKSNNRNYTFLEIQTPVFDMTTSRVKTINKVPRTARFRCLRAVSNQPRLFPDQEENHLPNKPYLILVHGITTIKHGNEIVFEELFGGIGMPNADNPSVWDEFISLNEFITLSDNIPDETIDEFDPAFLRLKRNFLGNSNGNDIA